MCNHKIYKCKLCGRTYPEWWLNGMGFLPICSCGEDLYETGAKTEKQSVNEFIEERHWLSDDFKSELMMLHGDSGQ